ncbi:MAG: serine/threonine protein kinase [Candidatus Eremiobacteraeota bacterium]|nr:serine/threonine protein kinase [Candidatus Eremiobacteraeota bacterium]
MIRLRRTAFVLGLLLLVGSTCPAQESAAIYKVELVTSPKPVDVFLDVSGQRQYEKFLGRTDGPILLDLSELQGASGFTLVLKREGYFDKRERISLDYFQKTDRYPEGGRIELTPQSWTVPLMDFLESHWPWVVVSLVLSGIVLGGLLSRRARVSERLRKLERFSEDAAGEDPLLQTVLGEWRLVRILGKGASATVYLAVPDDTLDESGRVAVKVFNEEMAGSQEFQERFIREAKLYQALNHPGIVQLLDWGQRGQLFYLVLEYVEGETLQGARVTTASEEGRALKILIELADALGHAHDAGVIHRDVKPGNVLIAPAGKAKLLDFGLAREVVSSFTKTGQALGTPLYMAPEQIAGGFVDHRCDQYALGVLAYELLTGQKTFQTDESEVAPLLFKQLHEEPRPMDETGAVVSEKTSLLVNKMMSRDVQERYANMGKVQEALREALKALP